MLDVSAVTSAATDALHALASKVNISQVTEVVVSTTDGVSVQVTTPANPHPSPNPTPHPSPLTRHPHPQPTS